MIKIYSFQIIPYEALEKHEMVCEYKLVKCPTCLLEMPQKTLSEHQEQCTSVLMASENCYTTYKSNAPPSFNAEINNLREQFERYRSAVQSEIQQLRQELKKNQSKLIVFNHLSPDIDFT